jgi:hypothetical protein
VELAVFGQKSTVKGDGGCFKIETMVATFFFRLKMKGGKVSKLEQGPCATTTKKKEG